MGRFGNYGRPVMAFEAYLDFADKLELTEADGRADFPGWLWGPIRRSVWKGYDLIEPQYRRYAFVDSVPDFRPQSMHGLGRLRGFGYVGEFGEYAGAHRVEHGGPTLVIDTYGSMYSITRHAIINDQSGELLNRNPRELGEEAGQFVAEAIVALIESNPTAWDGAPMFQAAGVGQRGNQVTSLLSEDSLVAAMTFLRNQRDLDNRRMRMTPRWLVVQNDTLALIAKRIINSATTGTTVNYTGGSAGVGTQYFDKGTDNVVQGLLPGDAVVVEPYYNDPNDWYLFADPAQNAAFVLGFLRGKEQPDVFLKDPGVRAALGAGTDPYSWEGDSIDFKVRHDFGVAPGDPKAAYRGTPS